MVGARDEHGMESWVTLEVKISKSKMLTNSLFLDLLERYHLMERLLNLSK
jgi:hypothetical protein